MDYKTILKELIRERKKYKNVYKFLSRIKPQEQKVISALKIFDPEHRTQRQKDNDAWKWVCYYKMCELLARDDNKDKSMNEVAINFCKSKEYIRWSTQQGVGTSGDVYAKARMFREHYTFVKKKMDLARKNLKKKK